MRSFFSCLFICSFILNGQDKIQVSTTKGIIEGHWTAREKTVAVFKGIPYAKSTVGLQRWKPPVQVSDWDGVFDASVFGPSCPQKNASQFWKESNALMNEDCLRLNIWTNNLNSNEKKPVMVYIHGGGLNTGNSHVYTQNGTAFAKQDVVLVTINYRLGVLGYLAHPLLSKESANAISGNYGFLDQLMALQWIQDHIAQFGGDPDNVTLFGESAGGTSVAVLAASPLSEGLIHKAIIQSPWMYGYITSMGEPNVVYLNKDGMGYPSSENYGVEWINKQGFKNPKKAFEMLRMVSFDSILIQDDYYKTKVTIDGYVLDSHPELIFMEGKQNDIPMIIGSNKDEGTFFHYVPGFEDLSGFINELKPFFNEDAEAIATHYFETLSSTVKDIGIAFIGDSWFIEPANQLAYGNAKNNNPTYQYQFSFVSPGYEWLGATHAAEIIYVFGNLNTKATQDQLAVSNKMIQYWVQFAKTGNPNNKGLPLWPEYNIETQSFLDINVETKTSQRLKGSFLNALKKAKVKSYHKASL